MRAKEQNHDNQVIIVEPKRIGKPTNVNAQPKKGLLHKILLTISSKYQDYEKQILENEIRKDKIKLAADFIERELARRTNLSLSFLEQNKYKFDAEFQKITEILNDMRNNREIRYESIKSLNELIKKSKNPDEKLMALKLIEFLHRQSSEELKVAFKTIKDAGRRQLIQERNLGTMLLSNKMEDLQRCLE